MTSFYIFIIKTKQNFGRWLHKSVACAITKAEFHIFLPYQFASNYFAHLKNKFRSKTHQFPNTHWFSLSKIPKFTKQGSSTAECRCCTRAIFKIEIIVDIALKYEFNKLIKEDTSPLKSTIIGLLALFLVLNTSTAFAAGEVVVSGGDVADVVVTSGAGVVSVQV